MGDVEGADARLRNGVSNRSDDDYGPIQLPPRTAEVVERQAYSHTQRDAERADSARRPVLVRETSDVRIATWNLEGKWTPRHHWMIRSLRADLLLLTEVLAKVEIPGLNIHFTEGEMQPGRHWAAVASSAPLRPLPDPHGATALAEIDGLRVASSILPWRNSGGAPPWTGQDQGSRTAAAVTSIRTAHPSFGAATGITS